MEKFDKFVKNTIKTLKKVVIKKKNDQKIYNFVCKRSLKEILKEYIKNWLNGLTKV